mmetsp:Transcript_26594/g.64839  ORF Transcript_26594/g.64839 Transcript_26594/m.64839 type:complete len:242 (-) Transcript_26594:203-928(-)
MANFNFSQSLAGLGVVTDRAVQFQRIKVVVSGNTQVPDFGHVFTVLLSRLGVVSGSQGSLVFQETNSTENGDSGKEGDGVESVQDRWSASTFLQQPLGAKEFSHWPSNNGQHGKTGVTNFSLLHGVQIELFRKTKRIESKVSCVGSIQLVGSLQHGQGNRHFAFWVVVSARQDLVHRCFGNNWNLNLFLGSNRKIDRNSGGNWFSNSWLSWGSFLRSSIDGFCGSLYRSGKDSKGGRDAAS